MTKEDIRKNEIIPGLVHLIYPNEKELAASFLRPQEFYESPEFKGKFFTLEEFKKWYTANSAGGKKTRKFTYYTDWGAFNVPDTSLNSFFAGKFNPLSGREKILLDLLEDKRENPFYAIGTFCGGDAEDIIHEKAHGLFYLDPEYKKKVMNVIKNMKPSDINTLHKYLNNQAAYTPEVFDDEVHAYTLTELDYLQKKKGVNVTRSMRSASKKLSYIFNKVLKSKK